MNVYTIKWKTDGSALVMTLLFIAVSAILAGGILQFATSHRIVAAAQVDMERALFVAEAGFERAGQYIANRNGFLDSTVDILNGTLDGGGSYEATIRTEPGWKQFSVTVEGHTNGVSRQVTVAQVFLPTYASYAMWSEVNGLIYYFPGEEFWGLIHSNDKLWFASSAEYGGPIFNDRVSSSASTAGGNTNQVVFRDGFELDAEEGSLAVVDFDFLKDRAGIVPGGIVLEGGTTIEINGNNMTITNEREGWGAGHTVSINPNQLIYVADAIDSGTDPEGRVTMLDSELDGRMSIVTEEKIFIQDHIRYANDPSDDGFNDPDDDTDDDFSDDALGLISKGNIVVDLSAPDDLILQAAILTTGQAADNSGSFGVDYWFTGSPRGDLKLYGSLVQKKRGYVNMSLGENAIVTGYRKTYSFDPRFATSSPPYYPEIANQIRYQGWSDGPVSP